MLSCDDAHASTLFKLRFVFGTQVACVVQTLTADFYVDLHANQPLADSQRQVDQV
jgi:hypothetical protein